MVNSTVIDMMMQNIADHVTLDKAWARQFQVVTLALLQELEKGYKKSSSSCYLDRLESKLLGKKLLLPVHIREVNHFVAVMVDFRRRSIGYGSLKPAEAFKLLQWWLSKRFHGPFKDLGRSMEHGQQEDCISCAITMGNMVAYKALDEPMWNISCAAHEHILWFNNLVKSHNQQAWPPSIHIQQNSPAHSPNTIEASPTFKSPTKSQSPQKIDIALDGACASSLEGSFYRSETEPEHFYNDVEMEESSHDESSRIPLLVEGG
ncbi:hypothetical protein L208DRAFT_1381549 [Tricholoma matsutake]|nr:hypothetical protein L208DRAFT_1381549 [Tricholoma matsutake 945]